MTCSRCGKKIEKGQSYVLDGGWLTDVSHFNCLPPQLQYIEADDYYRGVFTA